MLREPAYYDLLGSWSPAHNASVWHLTVLELLTVELHSSAPAHKTSNPPTPEHAAMNQRTHLFLVSESQVDALRACGARPCAFRAAIQWSIGTFVPLLVAHHGVQDINLWVLSILVVSREPKSSGHRRDLARGSSEVGWRRWCRQGSCGGRCRP